MVAPINSLLFPICKNLHCLSSEEKALWTDFLKIIYAWETKYLSHNMINHSNWKKCNQFHLTTISKKMSVACIIHLTSPRIFFLFFFTFKSVASPVYTAVFFKGPTTLSVISCLLLLHRLLVKKKCLPSPQKHEEEWRAEIGLRTSKGFACLCSGTLSPVIPLCPVSYTSPAFLSKMWVPQPKSLASINPWLGGSCY